MRAFAPAAFAAALLASAPAAAQQKADPEAEKTDPEKTEAEKTDAERASETKSIAIDAEERPSDVMRYPPSKVRVPIILSGIGLTALAYGIGAATAAAWPAVPGARGLYVPVAGPWITLANDRCSATDPGCGAILYLRGTLYVLSGLVQLGGLAVAAEGIFGTTEANEPEKKKSATVVPIATPQLAGIGIAGEF